MLARALYKRPKILVLDEIKRLSDVLGGVNALYNTHLGSVRSQVEALTDAVLSLVQQIDAKTINLPEALQPPAAAC